MKLLRNYYAPFEMNIFDISAMKLIYSTKEHQGAIVLLKTPICMGFMRIPKCF